MTILNTVFNVKDQGAKGNYSKAQANTIGTGTDDSDAFRRTIDLALKTMRRISQWNDQAVTCTIYIPAGTYLITKPESMLPSDYKTPSVGGLKFKGDGRGATEIMYNPSTPNTALMNNQNGYNFMTFEDMTFSSVGDIKGVYENICLLSFSSAQAQNYIFNNVQWGGGWKNAVKLVGTNCNSEHSWFHCGFSGRYEDAVLVPGNTTVNGDANTANDQFVNYNFFATQFETSKGNFLNFQRGGSINIWGGSLMYTGKAATENGTFFTLGDPVHAGANRFHLEGVRMEMMSESAQLLKSRWRWGTIDFIGLDQQTQSYHPEDTNFVNTIIDTNGDSGPIVNFLNCQLQGKHRYIFGANNWNKKSNISYQNCDLLQNAEPKDFLNIVATGGNRGGTPVIQFDNCKSFMNNDSTKALDCTYGWFNSSRGVSHKRSIKVTGADNLFPRSGVDQRVWIPLNAIITSIALVFEAGQAAGSGWAYYVKNSEGLTLHTATLVNPATGLNSFTDNVNHICSSDAKRQIIVSANGAVNSDVRGIIMIEYIGG